MTVRVACCACFGLMSVGTVSYIKMATAVKLASEKYAVNTPVLLGEFESST